MRTTFLCAGFAVLFPALANSETVADALRDFGLIGTWAAACTEGASPTNSHATYQVTPAGALQLRYQSGADLEDSVYDIREAKMLAPDKLSLRQILTSNEHVVLDIVLVKENDRIRIWSSLFPDGTALVEDGVMTTAAGRETRWMARCQ
jgi:hypothetical protein